MLERSDSYDAIVRSFEWPRPQRFNIGVAISDRWAQRDGERVALFGYREEGAPERLTFAALKEQSDAFASALSARGLRPGDRVAILLPQGFEAAIAYVAAFKMGAVALPLSTLNAGTALEFRIAASNARALVTNEAGIGRLKPFLSRLPGLQTIILSEGAQRGTIGFRDLIADHSGPFQPVETTPEDPALMLFTSGATAEPKAVLHAHSVLTGHLPGVEMPHDFFPRPGDLAWTPGEWGPAGGLLDLLLPSLYFGVPVVASRAETFEADAALALMERMGVRNLSISPAALSKLKSTERPGERFKLSLRSVVAAGDVVDDEVQQWAEAELGLSINQSYGFTECGLVLASSNAMGVSRAGAIGRPVPGHMVAVVDEEGRRLAPDTPGQIAVGRPDPAMFLEYWRDPEATAAKFAGDMMLTGAQALVDQDGYFHLFGDETPEEAAVPAG